MLAPNEEVCSCKRKGELSLLDEIGEMPFRCRPSIRGRWKKTKFVRLVRNEKSNSMFGFSPQPIAIWRRPSKKADFGRICSSGSTSSNWRSPARPGEPIRCCWRSFSSSSSLVVRESGWMPFPTGGRKAAGLLVAGNVRELRNVVERAVALTRHDKLTVDDLPDKIRDFRGSQVVIAGNDPGELTSLEEMSSGWGILHALHCLGDNRTLAAKTLGLDRKTLYRKLRQYGVIRDAAE